MKHHVSKVASTCFYQLRRLRQLRRLVGKEITAHLVSALILSRLHYCNALLAGLPCSTMEHLQPDENAAARLVCDLRPHVHMTPALKQLHWLPIKSRIVYKLGLLMHNIHTGRAPQYLHGRLCVYNRVVITHYCCCYRCYCTLSLLYF